MSTTASATERPVSGTGEVVIVRTESPTADVWTATWGDLIGPSDVTLDEALQWALRVAKPSEIRIITSNPIHRHEPGLIHTQCVEVGSNEVGPDGMPLDQS